MAKQPILLRDSASDAQARKNAGNSMQLRNLADINEDYPGVENVPLITSPSAAAVSTTITGKGINGATITPYFNGTAGTTTTVAAGVWTFTASATPGSYQFTQTIAGRPVSAKSLAVVTT
jgi:hypothetical protein